MNSEEMSMKIHWVKLTFAPRKSFWPQRILIWYTHMCKKNLKGQVTSKYQRYTKFWRIYICINVHVTDLIIKFLFIYFLLLFFLVTERAIRNKLFACTERDNYICGQQAWNLSTSWVKYNPVEAFCRGALGTWQAR